LEFAFTPEEATFREEVAAFLEKETPAEYREKRLTFFDMASQHDWIQVHRHIAEKLGEKGWLSLHWPVEYGGQGKSPFYRLILREELSRYHCPGYDSIGCGIVAPALLLKGSEEQKEKHLPGIASGKVIWCETLSEPNHGSDLAAIEVFAREEADAFVVNGQKIWTTNGHFADWNALVARTNREASPNYRGITFFLLDMKTPGITVNPIINMAGHHEFNEVFFEDVRIPRENIVGGLNQGFYVVMSLLDYERTADAVYAIAGTYLNDLAEYARENQRLDAVMENRLAQLMADCEVARLMHYRVTWMQSQGMVPNAESAMSKMVSFELHQRVTEFGMELAGEFSQLTGKSDRVPMHGRIPSTYLRSFGHSLEQGTSEIDRDVIAQRGLGLPRLR
jgi:alkylation response protein AidB-like acyl-CoA dehydrogenase